MIAKGKLSDETLKLDDWFIPACESENPVNNIDLQTLLRKSLLVDGIEMMLPCMMTHRR